MVEIIWNAKVSELFWKLLGLCFFGFLIQYSFKNKNYKTFLYVTIGCLIVSAGVYVNSNNDTKKIIEKEKTKIENTLNEK